MLFSRAAQLEPHETALLEQAAAIEERRRQEAAARKPAPGVARAEDLTPAHYPTPHPAAAAAYRMTKREHAPVQCEECQNKVYCLKHVPVTL